jgi:Protein of unknown function (DUF1153)
MSIKPIPTSLLVGATAPSFADQLTVEGLLPPTDTKRWVIRRKAAVVDAVRNGILSLEQACERYKLSSEEFFNWQRLVDKHGLAGLRVTRLQTYRGGDIPG